MVLRWWREGRRSSACELRHRFGKKRVRTKNSLPEGSRIRTFGTAEGPRFPMVPGIVGGSTTGETDVIGGLRRDLP